MVEKTSEIVDPIKHVQSLKQLVPLTILVSDIQPLETITQVLWLKTDFILGASRKQKVK